MRDEDLHYAKLEAVIAQLQIATRTWSALTNNARFLAFTRATNTAVFGLGTHGAIQNLMVATETGAPLDRGMFLVPGIAIRRGQVIAARYRVEELLGIGASGIVVAARHVWLRHEVTLKILVADTSAQVDAVTEEVERARAAIQLRGPHIARIEEIGTTNDGMPFVASTRFEGRTLEAELAVRGQLPPVEAARWITEACAGLAEAHAIGLVHGDLKPRNLFLAQGEDGRRTLKILDFGMRSPIRDPTASMWLASPAYLAPEQIMDSEQVDARTDVWALGVILYQLIAGRLPFAADTVSGMLIAVVKEEPSYLYEAPDDLALTVLRCLAKSPAERQQSVHALACALASFTEDEPPQESAAAASDDSSWDSIKEEERAVVAESSLHRRQTRRQRQARRRFLRRAVAAACGLGFGCGVALWSCDHAADAQPMLDEGSETVVVTRPSIDPSMLVRTPEPATPPTLATAALTIARRHLDRQFAPHLAGWPRMPIAQPFAPSNQERPHQSVRAPEPALPSRPRNESYYRTVFTPRRYSPRV